MENRKICRRKSSPNLVLATKIFCVLVCRGVLAVCANGSFLLCSRPCRYRKETEAPVDNTEVEHLLKCNYNVSEPLGYSSSAIASGGKSISISAAVPAAQTQCSLDVGYDSSYGSINTGPLRPYTSDGK